MHLASRMSPESIFIYRYLGPLHDATSSTFPLCRWQMSDDGDRRHFEVNVSAPVFWSSIAITRINALIVTQQKLAETFIVGGGDVRRHWTQHTQHTRPHSASRHNGTGDARSPVAVSPSISRRRGPDRPLPAVQSLKRSAVAKCQSVRSLLKEHIARPVGLAYRDT